MSSAILLFMAQAAIPPAKPGYGRGAARVTIRGVFTPEAGMNLAVRFRIAGKVLNKQELGKIGKVRYMSEDGAREHTIEFGEGAKFGAADVLLVYIHDLGNGPRDSSATLKVTIANAKENLTFDLSNKPEWKLVPDEPALSVPLAHLSGQQTGVTPVWSRP